jgi:glycosyltransferase involved in cell wall biosynthesis
MLDDLEATGASPGGSGADADGEEAHVELQHLRDELTALRREHEALGQSLLVRALLRYRAGLERWAPYGSRRRRAYARSVGALRGSLRASAPRSVGEPEPLPVAALVLPVSSEPMVSVLLEVEDDREGALRSLESLAAHACGSPFEVLAVGGSETGATLRHVEGLQFVEGAPEDTPLQKLRQAAARCRGAYVVLLRAGTALGEGWLDACVSIARADPCVGVVGGKVIDSGGRLREAGSIVWSDGSLAAVGVGEPPDYYPYDCVRDVDLCTRAALLVLPEVLLAAEPIAAAAPDYEDADLCFSARAQGFRVVFQPRASATTEVAYPGTGPGPSVEEARDRFRLRWRGALAEQFDRDASLIPLASRAAALSERHVMVVDFQVPRYDRDAGSLRMMRLLRVLIELGFVVTFLPEYRHSEQPYTRALQELGIQVAVGNVHERELIASLAPRLEFAILSRPSVAWRYVPMVRELAPAATLLFDTVDLHHLREQRRAELEGDADRVRVAAAWREMELGLVRACDATLVVSQGEREVLQAECPEARFGVVPTIHEVLAEVPGPRDRTGLLFVGSFAHPPNADAVLWFCEVVLPIVRESLPDVVLTIAGDGPSDEVSALESPGIHVTGWVPDLAPLHGQARVFVAPLRYGAGVKGKIAESLGFGLPVVSTRLGAEGMGLSHGMDVLLADTAEAFAAEIVRLHGDDDLWSRLSLAGQRRIVEQFSPTAVRGSVAQFLEELRPLS